MEAIKHLALALQCQHDKINDLHVCIYTELTFIHPQRKALDSLCTELDSLCTQQAMALKSYRITLDAITSITHAIPVGE